MNQEINPEALKEAMRRWITGVVIVTGLHNGCTHGMTANSFNSIALSPPTVMVALQKHSRTQNIVKDGGVFAVTILSKEQLTLAQRFAGQIDQDHDRFEGIETFTMISGAPLIKGGMGFLDCKVVNTFEIGDTTVFIGEVLASKAAEAPQEPLLYFNRQWRNLAP